MKPLNNIQSILFAVGGIMMVAGVGLYVFGVYPKATSIITLVGAIFFAVMQMMQRYEGTDITIRRLRAIMTIADVLFIVAGLFIFEDGWGLLYRPMVYGDGFEPDIERHITYMKYIKNNWVVVLLIAAILEMYSINRISSILKKQQRNAEKNLKE